MADAYGYLLQVRDGQVTICATLYDGSSGPVATLRVVGAWGVFDERMGAYVQRFIGTPKGRSQLQ